MNALVAIELISAVFVAVLTLRQFREHDASASAVWLKINSLAMLFWLIIDAAAYLSGLQYVLTLLAYAMGSVVLFIFLGFMGAFITKKSHMPLWLFRIPQILAIICTAMCVKDFVSGNLVVYENGIAVAVKTAPVFYFFIQGCLIIFALAVALIKRKELGWKTVAIFSLFSLSSVLGLISYPLLGGDYSVVFAAVSLMIIATFLQEHKIRIRLENAFAAISALIIFSLIVQSGVFTKTPSIDVKPNNCYKETLHVVTDQDYLPYSFYNANGNESGHDVELIIILANEMHMNLDLKFVSWHAGISSLAEGKADVLLTCDYYDNLEGMDGLLMTEPVSTDDFVVYSKTPIKHIDELYDKKIAIMENANCMSYINMYHLYDKCVFMQSNSEAIKAVKNRTVDCAIMRHTVAEAILKKLTYRNISSQVTIGRSFSCIGIGQNNRELQQRLNEAIETLKLDGTLQKLDEKWLTTFVHVYSLKEIFENNPWMAVVLVIVIALAIFFFVHEKRKRQKEDAENNARLFALEDNFISLYEVNLESGNYVSFDRGDFYQSNIREKLVSPVKFFENMRENVDRVVCEEDRNRVFEVQQKENIIKGLAENEHIDLYYRLITDNGPMWTKMRIVYKDDEKKNIILGIFNVNEEIAARKQAENIRTERMANIAGNVSSYIVNPKTNRFQVFKQDEYLSGKYTPNEDFSSSFERYINNDIYEPDRKKMRKTINIQTLLTNLEKKSEYKLAFRDITSGAPRWYELRATKLSDEEILMGFSDVNDDYAEQMIFSKMIEDYFALIYVYLDSGTAHAVKDEPGHLIGEGKTIPYSEMIGKIVSTTSGESREYFERLSNVGYLKEKFKKEEKAEYIYLSDAITEIHWLNLTQLVLERDSEGEPLVVAFGFRFLDEETKNVQKLQMQITEQQKKLEKALSMADAANKAKTDFLFNMSHDIRTPMNAIIGFTNIAKKEIHNPEKALDSLAKVLLSSDILLNLINDVLDMSRIESGKVELHEEKYEIIEAFDSFEPAMANLAASKDIDLKFTIGQIRDKFIFADGPRFDRVLINIISNAIKYTLPNGFVKVSVDQIENTKAGYGNYRFIVADSGIGMSEEFQKHMFESFTREENSTTSGIQGTGLGLSLAKKLIDLMGGTISCASTQGVGTTFTIVFPFRLQTEKDMAEKIVVQHENTTVVLNGRKALLVEDNELNREIGVEILSDKGVLVDTAENGQVAVKKVRTHEENYYDFILMDIQMPIMNGYEATKAIRNLLPDFKVPIIALSANAFAEDKKKSIAAGMDDHVAKPINVKELESVLSKFL